MNWRAALLAACLAVPTGLWAQDVSPAEAAASALEDLSAARDLLEAAKGGRERVAALSETVRAYEAGLSAVRAGLRRATIRERELSLKLAGQEEEIAALLTVLQARGRAGSPSLFLHPEGALGTARAGMIVSQMTPALNAQADALRETLVEVSTLRQLQAGAERSLQDGLTGVQDARTALSQAIADRTDLPRKFTEDAVKTALLIATTETLEAFAAGLGEISGGPLETAANVDVFDQKGALPLPVAGRVLRRAGEADAAGIKRPGVLLATRPRALVSAPVAATIRYQGPLLDFGNVMILEPKSGLLMVFAGLDVVYGRTGEVIAEGAPLGLMGGKDAAIGEILTQVGDGTGSDLSQSLYLEVREDNEPVNPESWFRTQRED
ncbi:MULTISPECIES: murein hydrolase activator EnvC family protein [Lentibacter]|jgi:murein hydrolase activator|uniref:Septal ring factor EnvC, activator of murein hydrolases AmiA and AmiB n=3 Tax=Lentibacter algarum TaxID=576131 RepID=A0A1H3LVF6_9RHOB|nr:peptidoglycan DD-metalloendopeptidase family protein [Lentibacter algarum]MCH9823697.1 peptidoglycan DD-metalloendopeptidase family protein [Alphaproteobacteria bacterium]MCO4826745.1 peptidoglycan DD-metalloendopeptidase family protein [Lentibacter algarum]WIF32745.1 Membrane-bound metallopeptidase [Lentibacter algarum]SDY68336.1 Septal ring factor EnvC, activator of murein hydrolases AmiA and AmiB [Lentibacter algarum]